MKYAILLLDTEAAQSMSVAELQAWFAEIGAWYEKGGGSGTLAEGWRQLASPATAKTVRANRVTGGPFLATTETLAGCGGAPDRHHRDVGASERQAGKQ